MQRHAAPAYAFCAQPLAPVSCIQALKPAPLHAMLSWSGGGDVVLRRHQAELVEERADRAHVVEEVERLAVDDVVVRGACVDRHFLLKNATHLPKRGCASRLELPLVCVPSV
jgi:hypothetical protein